MKKFKELHAIERPRERLLRYGPEKLSEAELLAILLRTGMRDCDVLRFSKKILNHFKAGSIAEAGVEELQKIKGLGEAKASEIIACFELGRRLLGGKKTHVIMTPEDVFKRMEDIRSSKKEHFVVFYLDSRSQEIKRELISVGTLNESLIHPREVFEGAIKNNAASIITSHNHPSGDTRPSAEDIAVTKRLVNAGRILDIEVLDHVIVSKTDWRSILSEAADERY